MMRCLNASNCVNSNRCISNFCVCNETRCNAITLPTVGAILYDISSSHHIYWFIFIFFVSIGLINNIFALITFLHDRIRLTVCGVYLIIFSICGIILMMLILTNILPTFRYNGYLFRLWDCHGYPYLFFIMINTGILMTTAIAFESLLNRYFSFNIFRTRKYALIISFILFILILISNLDKIFARHLISDQSGELYCTYKYQFWIYINKLISYLCIIIIPCLIHLICILCILSKMSQQKQEYLRKIFIYQDILIPSFIILICLFPYLIFYQTFDFSITYSRQFDFSLLFLYIPQILTLFIYILPNRYYLKEFQQTWVYRILFCGCCFPNKQRQTKEFEGIHKLWLRRTSLETVMSISTLSDHFVNSELYNKIRLEV